MHTETENSRDLKKVPPRAEYQSAQVCEETIQDQGRKKSFERIRENKQTKQCLFPPAKVQKSPNYTNRDFASVVEKINPDHTALILPNKA